MDTILVALLFGLGVWLMDGYNASKFRFIYPDLKPGLLPRGTASWKRVWVFRNQTFKRIGLFTFWAGVVLGNYFADNGEAILGPAFYIVGLSGLVLYVASRLWPFILDKRRRRR